MKIVIPEEFVGRLLRSYLKNSLLISSKMLTRLKNDEKGILLTGQHVTVRQVLHAGDVLEIADRDTEREESETVIPTKLPLCVMYEDENIIVLNKPPHMPTHPSHGHITDTLANALAYRYKTDGIPFVFRPLGRLDRNTSGIVIAGKTRPASGFLGRALIKGDVRKCYLAIVEGELECDGKTHVIDVPIRRMSDSIIMRTACTADEEGAESALTRYRVLASANGLSLLLAEPKTGRTHQLRVHFSHIGHPIIGDDIYGAQSPSDSSHLIDRHALHALSITVPVPFFRAHRGGAPTSADTQGIDDITDITDINAFLSLPLNTPDKKGYITTFAPLPADISHIITENFSTHPHFDTLSKLLTN